MRGLARALLLALPLTALSAIDAPTHVGGDKPFTLPPITLDVKDTDIRDALQRFADLTRLDIVLDPAVRGTVTVSAHDLPWDQALELILRVHQLGYVLEGGIVRIAPTGRLLAADKGAPATRRSMPRCFYAICPAVACSDAAIPPGECCPRCPSGRLGGPAGGSIAQPVR